MDQVAELVRDARKAGFGVKNTNGGHVRFEAPDGALVIGSSTPNKGKRSHENTKSMLRKHGLGAAIDKDDKRRQQSKQATKQQSLSIRVLEQLQAHPGRPFSPAELAEILAGTPREVGNALQTAKKRHPAVANPEKGVWIFEAAVVPAPQPIEEEESKPRLVRKWGAKGKVKQWIEEHPREVFTVDTIALDLSDVTKATIHSALFDLKTHFNGELEKPGRGAWRYNPAELNESARARIRLGMIQKELAHAGELRPLVRMLLKEEAERLEARLSAPVVLDPLPTQPAIAPVVVSVPEEPVRPIAVVPTELPDTVPCLFEAVALHRNGGVMLKDENSEFWLAHPIVITFPGG